MQNPKRNWASTSLLDAMKYSRYSRDEQETMTLRSEFFPRSNSIEDKDHEHSYVIDPENIFKIAWDILGFFVILYQAISIPFFIAFAESFSDSGFVLADYVFFVFFITDIALCFNTAYYNDGDLENSRREIIKNYLKCWFWIDIIATFPYEIIYSKLSATPSTFKSAPQLLRIIKLYRLLRLLRIAKLKKFLSQIEDHISSEVIINLLIIIRLILFALFIAHWVACAWYYLSLIESEQHPLTWLNEAYFETGSTAELYITSLYWAFTTMATVGYGDIVPLTQNEMSFAIVALLISCSVFAYTVGSIGVLVSTYTQDERVYREKCISINSYMNHKKIPLELKFRTRRYLEYIWDQYKAKNIGEAEILKLLSDSLKDEVFVYTRGVAVGSCMIFQKFGQHFMQHLCKIIEVHTFAPSDGVFEEGEKSGSMYFIRTGEIELYQNSTGTVIKLLKCGKHFGEIALFSGSPRCCSARSIDFLEVLVIEKQLLLIILEELPDSQKIFEYIMNCCATGDLTELDIRCYLCAEVGHVATKCTKYHLCMDNEHVKKKWLKSRTQMTKLVNPYEGEKIIKNKHKANLKKYSISNVIGVEAYRGKAHTENLAEKISKFYEEKEKSPELGHITQSSFRREPRSSSRLSEDYPESPMI